MASIIVVTSGLPSVVYPSVELARRLAAAGHRLTLAGLPDSRALVEHHGLDFLPLEPSRYQDAFEPATTGEEITRTAQVFAPISDEPTAPLALREDVTDTALVRQRPGATVAPANTELDREEELEPTHTAVVLRRHGALSFESED